MVLMGSGMGRIEGGTVAASGGVSASNVTLAPTVGSVPFFAIKE
jgi:hypothetical protein